MGFLTAAWALLDDGWVADPVIFIDGGIITSIEAGARGAAAERVDGLLLPAMANLHSHAFQRVFAGLTAHAHGGGDFWSWREAMYRAAAGMTPELYAPVMAWLGKELLKGGYGCHAEFHYLHHQPDGTPYAKRTEMALALAHGAVSCGISLTVLVGVYEAGGFGGAPLSGGQNRFRNNAAQALAMAADLRAGGIASGLALHSLRAVPAASLREAVAGFPQGPIHIHVSEQRAEVEQCIATLGAPPVAWLLENVKLDRRWCLVHATHADQAEIRHAACAGAVVGLCPATEADLGDGLFDFPALLQAGGAFGIGSDSNVMLDAFAELRLLEYGQRLRAEQRNVGAAEGGHCGRALWQQAARGGAAACGRAAGRIAVGQHADFVVIEPTPEAAGMAPDFALDAAIFGAMRAPARHVMVDGQWLVRDGVHRDEAAIDAAYARALRALAA